MIRRAGGAWISTLRKRYSSLLGVFLEAKPEVRMEAGSVGSMMSTTKQCSRSRFGAQGGNMPPMGSFTEVVLAFRFRQDTPAEILGAFDEWRVSSDAPSLPTLEESLDRLVLDRLDLFFDDWVEEDEFRPLSPLHKAVGWRSWCRWPETAYLPGTASAQMRWAPQGEYWSFTVRSYPKETSEGACMIFGPLGQFADFDPGPGEPQLVGYVRHEYDPRPTLVWNVGGPTFEFEDLRETPMPSDLRVEAPPEPPMSPGEWAKLQEGIERLRRDLGKPPPGSEPPEPDA